MDGIIFDIDGTLWDSTDSVAASWNRAIRENTSLDLTLDAGILSGLFGNLRDHPGVVYDGVADTIRKLYEKYPLFIVSNCQLGYIEVTMKGAGIESFIKDHLCFGETQVSKGETLLMLMERNNLKSPVYVGDTQGDADACRFAGIPFIFAEYGFGDVPDAETRIRSFLELGEMFL